MSGTKCHLCLRSLSIVVTRPATNLLPPGAGNYKLRCVRRCFVYVRWRTLVGAIIAVKDFFLRWSDDDAKAVDMCRSCLSRNHSEFNSEMCIHFSEGLEGLEKPAVFVYPKITVCLDCGHSEFSMPETELRSLGERRYPAVRKKASSPA